MNTYGLFSINITTFNYNFDTRYNCTKEDRSKLIIFFKIHNLVLNQFGYFPHLSRASGLVRMSTGLIMVMISGKLPSENEPKCFFVNHFYSEIITTGMIQIGRGALEAFFSNTGKIINLFLDIICTVINYVYISKYKKLVQDYQPKINEITLKPEIIILHEDPFPNVKWLQLI
ncbi:MAG: hypothetical protein Q8K60_03610 [Parachlamydiaceae bacterium]|nr:hypothetical protein [Parachlamydiaceae bacterium]